MERTEFQHMYVITFNGTELGKNQPSQLNLPEH